MIGPDKLIADLERILEGPSASRVASLQMIADTIRCSSNHRWVGLYDVDHDTGIIRNIVFSGPGAPAYPEFPITKGLTGVAVAERRTVNVGNVAADKHYLTAFGTTQSEIIVPIFDNAKHRVIGTIDIESERRDAFSGEIKEVLEWCASVICPLWQH